MSSQTAESRLSPEADAACRRDEHRESDTGSSDIVAAPSRPNDEERSHDSTDKTARKSRSRSPSPSKGITRAVRQTASPVRSLPPVISVTPDTPDTPPVHGKTGEPQRAVISYSSHVERSQRDSPQREASQSPPPSLPMAGAHFIAFPASQIPTRFFSMAEDTDRRLQADPSVTETTLQLLRALRLAGISAMRHFIGYLASNIGTENSRDKIKEVELTLCALLLLIAGLLIYFFGSERTVTYHHHWDYFNPPK
ncbi:hypothetical protein KM043_017458 [Ampulex compressa]|nr:hypothetical protein KM043_017458 [Ampulex compressa]